jgi:hypothetical protein
MNAPPHSRRGTEAEHARFDSTGFSNRREQRNNHRGVSHIFPNLSHSNIRSMLSNIGLAASKVIGSANQ